MSLDPKIVKKVAKLARIRLSEEGVAHATKDLSGIFDWIEQLQEVNTDGVEPMAGVGNNTLRLRKDEVNDGNIRDDLLKNAPAAEFDCYKVPKVVE